MICKRNFYSPRFEEEGEKGRTTDLPRINSTSSSPVGHSVRLHYFYHVAVPSSSNSGITGLSTVMSEPDGWTSKEHTLYHSPILKFSDNRIQKEVTT